MGRISEEWHGAESAALSILVAALQSRKPLVDTERVQYNAPNVSLDGIPTDEARP